MGERTVIVRMEKLDNREYVLDAASEYLAGRMLQYVGRCADQSWVTMEREMETMC